MDASTGVGIAASALTALSLLPQLIKLYREKQPHNVSMGMLGVLCAGLILWVVYGAMICDWIIIIANSFSLLINIITMIMVGYYRRKG